MLPELPPRNSTERLRCVRVRSWQCYMRPTVSYGIHLDPIAVVPKYFIIFSVFNVSNYLS